TNLYGNRPEISVDPEKPGVTIKTGRFVFSEPEASVVRRIFAMALQGTGPTGIARQLNRQGIPSPHANRTRRTVRWCDKTIRLMLTNAAYAGVDHFWKTSRINERDIPRPKSEWVRMPSIREPLIKPDHFERLQRLMDSRSFEKYSTRPVLLRGFIF